MRLGEARHGRGHDGGMAMTVAHAGSPTCRGPALPLGRALLRRLASSEAPARRCMPRVHAGPGTSVALSRVADRGRVAGAAMDLPSGEDQELSSAPAHGVADHAVALRRLVRQLAVTGMYSAPRRARDTSRVGDDRRSPGARGIARALLAAAEAMRPPRRDRRLVRYRPRERGGAAALREQRLHAARHPAGAYERAARASRPWLRILKMPYHALSRLAPRTWLSVSSGKKGSASDRACDVLADRELALAVAEALAVEAHQVDRRQIRLRIHAGARICRSCRRGRPRPGAGRRTRTRSGGHRPVRARQLQPSMPASARNRRRPSAPAPPSSSSSRSSWASPIAHATSDRR